MTHPDPLGSELRAALVDVGSQMQELVGGGPDDDRTALNRLEAKLLALVAAKGYKPALIRAALADPAMARGAEAKLLAGMGAALTDPALAREVALVVAAFPRLPDHPLVDIMFRVVLRDAVLDPLLSDWLAYMPPDIRRKIDLLSEKKAERAALPKDDKRRPALTQAIYNLNKDLKGWVPPNPKGPKADSRDNQALSAEIKQRGPE